MSLGLFLAAPLSRALLSPPPCDLRGFPLLWWGHEFVSVSQRSSFSAPFGRFFLGAQVVSFPGALVPSAGDRRKTLPTIRRLGSSVLSNSVCCVLMPPWPARDLQCVSTKGDLPVRCRLQSLSQSGGYLRAHLPFLCPRE